ncbi:DUF4936 family protein [Telluria aromaticivorans]|uniref:DUF4936 family protein n=1 Tax=Telluria aromaticivorans TaxID=2725995 RepID=A0A7Y2JVF1_9BURK|nr:DUF4936 family protein [Telluria aromaticivorans]NNG21398.1 DUF4936 family protein [Telluria aromaticivorans]
MIDLYVYYKVRAEDAAHLEPRVRAMQARLAASGAAVQLKHRPEARDGLQTWMEVYPGAGDGFDGVVDACAREAGLDAYTQGPRRSEIFMDLPLCA